MFGNGRFAGAQTNTGHEAAREPDATFAVDSQKLLDDSFRSLHVTAETAKRLAAAHYGERLRKSYYNGCSTGGRRPGAQRLGQSHPRQCAKPSRDLPICSSVDGPACFTAAQLETIRPNGTSFAAIRITRGVTSCVVFVPSALRQRVLPLCMRPSGSQAAAGGQRCSETCSGKGSQAGVTGRTCVSNFGAPSCRSVGCSPDGS